MLQRKHLILASGFGIHVFVWGSAQCMGIFTEVFMHHYQLNNATASLFMSFLLTTLVLVSPLNLLVLEWLGCRTATIIGSILAGCSSIACGFFYTNFPVILVLLGLCLGATLNISQVGCQLVVPRFFNEHEQQWAFTTMSVGAGFGIFVYPFVYSELLKRYSWQQTLLLNGALLFNLVPCCMLLPRKLSLNKRQKIDADQNTTNLDAQKVTPLHRNPVYINLAVCHLTIYLSVCTYWAFVYPLLLTEHGYETAAECARLLLLVGLSSLIGKLFLAVSHLMFRLHPVYYASLVSIVYSVGVILLSLAGDKLFVAIPSVILTGAGYGMLRPLLPTAIARVVPEGQFHRAFTFGQWLLGVGSLSGPFVLAVLMDHIHSYITPMIIGAVMNALVFLTLILVHCFTTRQLQGDAEIIEMKSV